MLCVLRNFMEIVLANEKLIQSAYAAFNLQCMSGHVVCVKPLCRHESEHESLSHLVTLTINILHSMAETDSASLYGNSQFYQTLPVEYSLLLYVTMPDVCTESRVETFPWKS